jgi:hypothetical protein
MILGPTGGVPGTYNLAGYPAVQVWLLAGMVFALLAVLLRLGLFSLAGIGMLWMARSTAVSMHTMLTSEAADGRFAVTGTEMMNFLDLSWLLMGMLAVLTAQITYANSVDRKLKLAAGEEPDPGVLDVYGVIQASLLNRYGRGETAGKAPISA